MNSEFRAPLNADRFVMLNCSKNYINRICCTSKQSTSCCQNPSSIQNCSTCKMYIGIIILKRRVIWKFTKLCISSTAWVSYNLCTQKTFNFFKIFFYKIKFNLRRQLADPKTATIIKNIWFILNVFVTIYLLSSIKLIASW
jgi:hypothetical protein